MWWLKRGLWKTGIAITGMQLLLVLMVWVPMSAASVHEGGSESATLTTVTIQVTPTEDATMTALNKEKLAQEVQQLKNQNEPDLLGWLRTNASLLLSALVVVIGGLIGLGRWLGDRRSEREKRAEERFQAAVTGLGDEKEGVRVGAAILLRTFLREGYEQFYSQAFDLAVANLRLRHLDPDTPEPLTSLSQALIIVFKESFPLAHERLKQSPQFLDASCIQLDNAHLADADLQQMWLPEASLRNATLRRADFSEANLYKANLSQADLKEAILTKTNFYKANLVSTDFSKANLSQADLRGANLSGVDLKDVQSLKGTDLRGAIGLTGEQLEVCKAGGAIIDEHSTIRVFQSSIVPPPQPQSNDTQAQSATPVHEGPLASDTGDSSTASLSSQSNNAQASSALSAQESIPTSDLGRSSTVSLPSGSES